MEEIKMNTATRMAMALGLFGGVLFSMHGDAQAQTATNTNGPVCAVEYVPQGPYSSTAPALRIQVSTSTTCAASKHIYTICPSTSSGQSQCGTTSYAHYPADVFAALYQNALNAQTANLWLETTGSCTAGTGGNLNCLTSAPLRFKTP
jgi:hypothetical protein